MRINNLEAYSGKINTLTIHANDQIVYEIDRHQVLDDGKITFLDNMDRSMDGGILLLTQAIQQDPANTRIAMDMLQIFIDTGRLDQAKPLFNKLPDREKKVKWVSH